MTSWKQSISRWRALPPEEQHRRRVIGIPRAVARSMAFADEPVSVEMLEAEIERRRPDLFAPKHGATAARFSLIDSPLPRIEETLRVGECFRRAVMSLAGTILGDNKIPPVFSGHDLPLNNRHDHAFYLPDDSNNNGYIDNLTVYVPGGMNQDHHRVLVRLTRLWDSDGGKWRLVLRKMGGIAEFRMSPLFGNTTVWISGTPYLHPWHAKKKFTVEDQIQRECNERGLPEITDLERLASVRVNGRDLRPDHFHCLRKKRDLVQPDTHGSFWKIEFAEPVQGPLALGFACHFGLGLFIPALDA